MGKNRWRVECGRCGYSVSRSALRKVEFLREVDGVLPISNEDITTWPCPHCGAPYNLDLIVLDDKIIVGAPANSVAGSKKGLATIFPKWNEACVDNKHSGGCQCHFLSHDEPKYALMALQRQLGSLVQDEGQERDYGVTPPLA
jgi:hypothetical protein